MTTEKAFQNAVKDALAKTDITIDALTCRKNGNVEVKQSYFYTFGMTAEKYAEQVRKTLEQSSIPANIIGEDRWTAWPKTSYFVAIISPRVGN